MGSSSAFTVGLLHALYALQGVMPAKRQLALESIHIEQNMIKETVGAQDQCTAAYGGLNHLIFKKGGEIEVRPLILPRSRLQEFNDHQMLFYTGIMRTASVVAKSYVDNIEANHKLFMQMQEMVEKGISILQSNKDIYNFGELLHEAWTVKQSLSSKVTNSFVNDIYERARRSGAIGGKVTGAGGGGFLLLFVPPSERKSVREELSELLHVPFRFDSNGSQIIFYDPYEEDYSHIEMDRTKRNIQSFREMSILKD